MPSQGAFELENLDLLYFHEGIGQAVTSLMMSPDCTNAVFCLGLSMHHFWQLVVIFAD